MVDVPEHLSDTAQEKSAANDVQIIASQKKKRECQKSFSSESLYTSNVFTCIGLLNT